MKFINRKFVYLILSLVLLSFQTNCQEKTFEKSVLSEKAKESYQALLKIDMFALNGIGSEAKISEGENALNSLIQDKNSILALEDLVKNATPEGGLYALVGLKIFKCDCLKEQTEIFKNLPEKPDRIVKIYERETPKGYIFQMDGCLFQTKNRIETADEIVEGRYDSYLEKNFK